MGYNGVYTQMTGTDGVRNGAPQLVLTAKDETFGEPDASRIIFRDVDTRGAKWWLYPGYFNASNPQSEVPPEEGWQISVGKQPAPSVQLVVSRE